MPSIISHFSMRTIYGLEDKTFLNADYIDGLVQDRHNSTALVMSFLH